MNNFSLQRIEAMIKAALKERPTGDDWLDARYAEQAGPPVFHTQPYYKLFYYIAQEFKPEFVAILGGYQGTDAAHFAAGAPEATVITIDHHADPGTEADRAKMLEATQQYPNIKYLRGWTTPGYSEEYYKRASDGFEPESVFAIVADQILQLGKHKLNILFVDSWHENRYFGRDLEYYIPLLASHALIICDDVDTVTDTYLKLPGEKFLNTEVHPGIPMGFIEYGLSADRPAGRTEPKAAPKRKTRAVKPARKRAA